MDGRARKLVAAYRVGALRGTAADDVAWIDVLHARVEALLLEVRGNAALQKLADVLLEYVAACVALLGALQKLLPCALGHDDDGV